MTQRVTFAVKCGGTQQMGKFVDIFGTFWAGDTIILAGNKVTLHYDSC